MTKKIVFWGLMLLSSVALGSQGFLVKTSESAPAYIENRDDPMQQAYSVVLIGYAFERKCSLLEEAKRSEFVNKLNLASEIFQGYLVGTNKVATPDEAISYSTDMALGSIKFAAQKQCDSVAQQRVDAGLATASNFILLVEDQPEK